MQGILDTHPGTQMGLCLDRNRFVTWDCTEMHSVNYLLSSAKLSSFIWNNGRFFLAVERCKKNFDRF